MLGCVKALQLFIEKNIKKQSTKTQYPLQLNHHKIREGMLVLVLIKDYTEKCLKLEDVILEKVENINGEQHIYVSMPLKEHACPRCALLLKRLKTIIIKKLKIQKQMETRFLSMFIKDAIFVKNVVKHSLKRIHF